MKCVETQKYLGIEVKHDFTDDLDIKRHVKPLYTRGNILVHTFNRCSDEVKHCLEATVLAVMVVHYGILTKWMRIGNML